MVKHSVHLEKNCLEVGRSAHLVNGGRALVVGTACSLALLRCALSSGGLLPGGRGSSLCGGMSALTAWVPLPPCPAGQRRLWEAVKRRKAMCKRKSWMSKVGGLGRRWEWGFIGAPLTSPGSLPSPRSVISHFVQTSSSGVLSGRVLVELPG